MKTVLVGALALSLFLAAAPTIADGRDPAAADVLFREGRALMKKGDYQVACPKLAESHRLDPAAGTAVNLGDCVEKLGKLADALQAYRDALELLPAGDFRIASVKVEIAVLEKRTPRLTVKLASGAPKGTRVIRDDVELGGASLGVALPVNPGEHFVAVRASKHTDKRYDVTLAEGSTRELIVEPGPAEAPTGGPPRNAKQGPAPAERHSPPSSSSGQRTFGWIALGVGAVVLESVIGNGLWLDDRKGECRTNPDSCEAAKARLPVYYGSWAVAAAGLSVGAYLLLWAPSDGVHVGADFTSGHASISAERRF